jgi:ketosteroid isomerase-like protein
MVPFPTLFGPHIAFLPATFQVQLERQEPFIKEQEQMASEMAERFMQTLQEIEQSGDVEPMVALFAEESEASNLAHSQPHRGKEGARKFWQEYLSAFKEIHSTFHNVIEGESAFVLEWTSEGSLPSGEPIHYPGVSIVETGGGEVRRFRTYYDSAAFLPQRASSS